MFCYEQDQYDLLSENHLFDTRNIYECLLPNFQKSLSSRNSPILVLVILVYRMCVQHLLNTALKEVHCTLLLLEEK